MKVYVNDLKDTVLDSPIDMQELAVMIAASKRGVAHSQILVSQGERKGLLDTRDIDSERTLEGMVLDRAS